MSSFNINDDFPGILHDTLSVNTLRPRRNEQHFADDIFKRIFFNENVWLSIKISLKFVPKGPINNIPALVQIMAWHRWGDKPLSEPMMVSLPTHICVTRPQWVKTRETWKSPRLTLGKNACPQDQGIAKGYTGKEKMTGVLNGIQYIYICIYICLNDVAANDISTNVNNLVLNLRW